MYKSIKYTAMTCTIYIEVRLGTIERNQLVLTIVTIDKDYKQSVY